jgi:uncharacterized protein YfdQ (DUF2303 family)
MSETSDYKQAFNAGAAAYAKGIDINGVPFLITPEGYELREFKNLMQHPIRAEQHVTAHTPESFLFYWNRFANESSTIFFDLRAGSAMGVIDYHAESGTPGFCNHTIRYTCPRTPEWNKWKENSGKKMTQNDFALFIEDSVPDILEPNGGEMLEIASSLQANNKVTFRSAVRLDNGETQFVYEENIDGRAGAKGNLKIPQSIKIGVRLFEGGAGYQLEARFRYSIKDGQLVMWYDLVRPHLAHENAVTEVYSVLEEGMSNGHILRGSL